MPTPPSHLPRVLIVSNTYLSRENRKKLYALREFAEVTCAIPAESISPLGTVLRPDLAPEDDSIRLIPLQAIGAPNTVTRYLLRGLSRVLREHFFDAVIVEAEPWAWLRWQTWVLARWYQKRALFGDYSWENFQRPGWKGAVLAVIYRLANRTADFSIGGNDGAVALFRRYGRAESSLLGCPQMGVDPDTYRTYAPEDRGAARADLSPREDRFRIGFAGRWTAFKGVLDLLKSVEVLREQYGDRFEVHLLGGGDLAEELARRADSTTWLILHPPVPPAEVARFLNGIDLFVHASKPSRDSSERLLFLEQTPYALGQAMACGVAAIGGAGGAIPGMITVPEMLVDPGDCAGLARLIEQLWQNPERRATVAAAQSAWARLEFTHTAVARRWADFLARQLQRPQPERLVCLADWKITEQRHGPRRHFDVLPGDSVCLIPASWLAAASDEEIHLRVAWLKTQTQRRLYFRIAGLFSIARHWIRVRAAEVIYCRSPHYFWWLLFLHRIGLLRLPRQRVIILYFLSESFLQRLDWWKDAPQGFHAFFVSREQLAEIERRGCPPGRQSYVAFCIDTKWFCPIPQPRGGYLLVAGNSHRDESLIIQLARDSPLPIVRAGQIGLLRDFYRGSPARLVFNASHSEYLELLQNATALLLPIEPCDEPAGLTATLEALACEVPVLANASMEIGTLLQRALGAAPLADLRKETWLAAIYTVITGKGPSPADLRRGREYVVAEHSIPDPQDEWHPLLGSFAAPPPSC